MSKWQYYLIKVVHPQAMCTMKIIKYLIKIRVGTIISSDFNAIISVFSNIAKMAVFCRNSNIAKIFSQKYSVFFEKAQIVLKLAKHKNPENSFLSHCLSSYFQSFVVNFSCWPQSGKFLNFCQSKNDSIFCVESLGIGRTGVKVSKFLHKIDLKENFTILMNRNFFYKHSNNTWHFWHFSFVNPYILQFKLKSKCFQVFGVELWKRLERKCLLKSKLELDFFYLHKS